MDVYSLGIQMGLPSTISRSVGKGHGKPKAENTPFSPSPAIGTAPLISPSLYLSLIPLEIAYPASHMLWSAEPVRMSRWMPKVDGFAR